MIQLFVICALAVISATTAAPQLITFKDGNVGVNFGGYSAQAGLGGILTGNAADGGLSASAGTPFGQRAAAGLFGSTNGAGTLYAGAQANNNVGASTILGGSTGPQPHGYMGAEAHSNGISKTVTKVQSGIVQNSPTYVQNSQAPLPFLGNVQKSVQKVKPPKKFIAQTNAIETPVINAQKSVDVVVTPAVTVKSHHPHGVRRLKRVRPSHRRISLFKQVSNAPAPSQRFGGEDTKINNGGTTYTSSVQKVNGPVYSKEIQYSGGGLEQFFNIPIGILQAIRDNLQPIGVQKQASFTKGFY